MASEYPINRIAHFFENANELFNVGWQQFAESRLIEFTDTAIDFTEVEAPTQLDPISENSAPIVRLVQLMIVEALREGAESINIELKSTSVSIQYLMADGRVIDRDRPPARLFNPMIRRIKLLADRGGEIIVGGKTLGIDFAFRQGEPPAGVTMKLRRT